MKIIAWMFIGLFGPWLIFVTFAYTIAFPWHALGVVLAVVAVIVVIIAIILIEGDLQAQSMMAPGLERERLAEEAEKAAFLHKAMSPGYQEGESIVPAGTVEIRRGERRAGAPNPYGSADPLMRDPRFYRG